MAIAYLIAPSLHRGLVATFGIFEASYRLASWSTRSTEFFFPEETIRGFLAMSSPIAPSKSLLRFLRSQSDSVCFLIAHPTSTTRGHCSTTIPVPAITARRPISTTSKKTGRSQTSCVGDSLWARPREICKALPPPRHYLPPSPSQPPHCHQASTKAKHSGFWGRLLRHREAIAQAKIERDKRSNDISDDTSAQLFNLSRALSRNPPHADVRLRCTEFDANGSVTLVSGEFKKSELIAKYGLQPRDLRKLDSSVLPHILVRPTAILINLLHLRVLIQSDRVLVFDAYGSTDSYTQSLFMYDLEGKLRQKADPRNGSTHLPYEFRALEAVLISVTSGLEAEFALVRDPVTHILRELEEDIDREKLRHLLIHSKKLGTFEQKARLVRDAIDDLLNADDDLAAMYLTERKLTGKPRDENDHQEVEMLLESYHKICDEIVEISGNLISNIRNTEEVVKAILDANRNELMLLEIKFSIGTLGLAAGTLLAGLYGMNLKNFIEESDLAFGGVAIVCFGVSAIICVYGMRKLRKVQKVRMWGEGLDVLDRTGRTRIAGRRHWRNETVESPRQRIARLKGAGTNPAGTGHSGPVLWPGMDGLGMHKLNVGDSGSDTDSDANGYAGSDTTHDEPTVTIHDDVGNAELRMREDARKQKTVVKKSDKVMTPRGK